MLPQSFNDEKVKFLSDNHIALFMNQILNDRDSLYEKWLPLMTLKICLIIWMVNHLRIKL